VLNIVKTNTSFHNHSNIKNVIFNIQNEISSSSKDMTILDELIKAEWKLMKSTVNASLICNFNYINNKVDKFENLDELMLYIGEDKSNKKKPKNKKKKKKAKIENPKETTNLKLNDKETKSEAQITNKIVESKCNPEDLQREEEDLFIESFCKDLKKGSFSSKEIIKLKPHITSNWLNSIV